MNPPAGSAAAAGAGSRPAIVLCPWRPSPGRQHARHRPLLVQLAATFGVSVGAASIAATAFLFANGVFVLVHGPFGDRYGKMPVVAIACIMAALCCSSAMADLLAWLAAARF